MSLDFKIFIDRLKGGQKEKIEGIFDSSFLDVEESELSFSSPVAVQGEAYISEDHLVLRLNGQTTACMPCAVCNKMIQVPLKVINLYHAQPLEEVKEAIFNFSGLLREALLLELPHTAECQGGNCPERETLAPYLRSKQRSENTTYFPFSDLEK